jgi:hypothetical protein
MKMYNQAKKEYLITRPMFQYDARTPFCVCILASSAFQEHEALREYVKNLSTTFSVLVIKANSMYSTVEALDLDIDVKWCQALIYIPAEYHPKEMFDILTEEIQLLVGGKAEPKKMNWLLC